MLWLKYSLKINVFLSIHSGKETPLVLFNIPDGHTKTTPITTVPLGIAQSNAKVI